jgi:sulfide:quinone oxidoreductase
MPSTTPIATPEIVVVGGGIAALELLLALRDMAGDRVHMTLVAAQPDFVLRPMLVAEALGRRGAKRRPLTEITDDLGVTLVRAAVASVDTAGRRVILRSGDALPYDSLVLAHGAHTIAAFEGVIAIGGTVEAQELRTLREEIASGEVRSVAFVAPTRAGWLVPLYEAALLTANSGHGVRVSLITREVRPLELFGAEANAKVGAALEAAGIDFIEGRTAYVSEGNVLLPGHPRGSISADRIVSLPLVRGLRVAGIPATGLFGLIPVDRYGHVKGLEDVYAVGDATDYPVKQGGIACQQADSVATVIASHYGATMTPVPFHPILRATLLTGTDSPIPLGEGAGIDELAKVPGRYLAPYLQAAAEPIAA